MQCTHCAGLATALDCINIQCEHWQNRWRDCETHESDCEFGTTAIHNGNEIDKFNFDDDSELVDEIKSLEFSNDAGLWDISENFYLLQTYWIGKGEYRVSNNKLRLKIGYLKVSWIMNYVCFSFMHLLWCRLKMIF